MRIAVVGTGYVGLVAGVCFADSGHTVGCLDVDDSKVRRLNAGECPIYEPGLESMIQRNLDSGRLVFSSDYAEVITRGRPEVVFLAVGTPSTDSGDADLKYLKRAVEQVVAALSAPVTLVTKSTVPVGTRQKILEWIGSHARFPVHIASNPEFLREGCAVEDFLRPDRVVVGAVEDSVFEQLESVYAPFLGEKGVLLKMDPVSAEMTKYACNSFLAAKVSFMNELSVLCEKLGADIDHIRQGMGLDHRIGKDFLFAGAGFGGSCFPKDLRALLSTARSESVNLGIVHATESSNERQKRRLFEKINAAFGGKLNEVQIGVWGLAFKPNTDDVREAPALVLIRQLLDAGAHVVAYDPVAAQNAAASLGRYVERPEFKIVDQAYDAASGADALVLVTEWSEFKSPDWSRIVASMRGRHLFDGRNVYRARDILGAGLNYHGIGRPSVF